MHPTGEVGLHESPRELPPNTSDSSPPSPASAGAEPVDDQSVEDETTGGELIMRPFDPNKIRVKLTTPTVDLVLKRISANEIDLAPDFQRAAGIWKERAQSRLVESLLIRIPLPAFYVDGSGPSSN
jgi:hypothetical protein